MQDVEEELEFLAVVEELEFLVLVKELRSVGEVEVWGSSHEEVVGLVPWEVSEVLE